MGKRDDTIEVRWHCADGYVGGKRPQYLKIDPENYRDLSREEIEKLLWDDIETDFNMKVSAEADDLDTSVEEILAWLEAHPEDDNG